MYFDSVFDGFMSCFYAVFYEEIFLVCSPFSILIVVSPCLKFALIKLKYKKNLENGSEKVTGQKQGPESQSQDGL